MKEKTCCFTGHRNIPISDYKKVKKVLYKKILNLVEKGVVYFGSGGALGFDTLAAETVLNVKKKFPQVKLIMVYPCKNQTELWNMRDVKTYNKIKNKCDKYVYSSNIILHKNPQNVI